MLGTSLKGVELIKVIDGDTVKVVINGEQESLRLICLDTEEIRGGGSKPVTNAGKFASQWAKGFFGADDEGNPTADIRVDIEFDTNNPLPECLEKHRGNYGRLLCYVYKRGENYNLKAIEAGWSPYFVKYGRSRLYHGDFLAAEAAAQATGIGIWDPTINADGKFRDYSVLIPWWHLRDSVVQDYRQFGVQQNVRSVRLDYDQIVAAANNGDQLTVFCDLQGGINQWPGNGALIFAGSPQHKFNLWIPDRDSTTAQQILRLIDTRYTGYGRGYVYASGQASLFPPNERGKPQIVLTAVTQLADQPPSSS
jgi:micrococcal nuclease